MGSADLFGLSQRHDGKSGATPRLCGSNNRYDSAKWQRALEMMDMGSFRSGIVWESSRVDLLANQNAGNVGTTAMQFTLRSQAAQGSGRLRERVGGATGEVTLYQELLQSGKMEVISSIPHLCRVCCYGGEQKIPSGTIERAETDFGRQGLNHSGAQLITAIITDITVLGKLEVSHCGKDIPQALKMDTFAHNT